MQVREDVMRGLLLGCVVFVAMSLTGFTSRGEAATEAVTFPVELRDTWDPTRPCDRDEVTDSDSRFTVMRDQRLNYEEIEDIVSVELLTTSPMAWRIVTTSNVGPPGLALPSIYVLRDDHLVTTDGSNAHTYLRCK
jgi:hypothetical protein